jgi:predicted lipase
MRYTSCEQTSGGSPRVGDRLFSEHFDKLRQERAQAYRIVNDKDIAARMPRTKRSLSLGRL